MILQSLVEYYELMAAEGKLPKPGYCIVKVSYALNLSENGTLLNIVNIKATKQLKKKVVQVPRDIEVPEQLPRSANVSANFLCDNSTYLLGIDRKGNPNRSAKCFAASRKFHIELLQGVHTPLAKAVTAFFQKWDPEKASKNSNIEENLQEVLEGGNLIFMLNGRKFAQDDPEIRCVWEKHYISQHTEIKKPCLVTGKVEPVAILHPKIKELAGAQTAGANLVSFNARAYESYGGDCARGMNAPVGQYAAFAYTTALNYLLSDKKHCLQIGNTTVIYWAASTKRAYRDIFSAFFDPENEKAKQLLQNIMENMVAGNAIAKDMDLETSFYILALEPNAARISVRFFLHDSFGNFLKNLSQYYKDIEIIHAPQEFSYLTPYWLLHETVASHSSDEYVSPQLIGEVLRAILLGYPFPKTLQNVVLLRIRAERSEKERNIRKITRGRAAILKAYLLRQIDKHAYMEVLSVSLNENSNNCAYLLGRLFAMLEKVQIDATPSINTTIQDPYFALACAMPQRVFPLLFKLHKNHIATIQKRMKSMAFSNYENKLIAEIMDKLKLKKNSFPEHLCLNDQSIFVLGYYHQVQSFFTPKNKKK
ncbi:MAG: Type I-C CRISPR-associated protein Cas8c/Csd1 [Oscillospiraceae bacterium]|jgi:CRISPR-associated protein Csd1